MLLVAGIIVAIGMAVFPLDGSGNFTNTATGNAIAIVLIICVALDIALYLRSITKLENEYKRQANDLPDDEIRQIPQPQGHA